MSSKICRHFFSVGGILFFCHEKYQLPRFEFLMFFSPYRNRRRYLGLCVFEFTNSCSFFLKHVLQKPEFEHYYHTCSYRRVKSSFSIVHAQQNPAKKMNEKIKFTFFASSNKHQIHPMIIKVHRVIPKTR